jgi:hypothetical protein
MHEIDALAIAPDVMQPPVSIRPQDGLHDALDILGFLDESDITLVYLQSTAAAGDGRAGS